MGSYTFTGVLLELLAELRRKSPFRFIGRLNLWLQETSRCHNTCPSFAWPCSYSDTLTWLAIGVRVVWWGLSCKPCSMRGLSSSMHDSHQHFQPTCTVSLPQANSAANSCLCEPHSSLGGRPLMSSWAHGLLPGQAQPPQWDQREEQWLLNRVGEVPKYQR